ncbi:MAG TPA: hypothetical protein VGG18_11200 [Granulicella sp.]
MSAIAIRVFTNITETWTIEDQDAALLLGEYRSKPTALSMRTPMTRILKMSL